jgi:hypothetical protein
MALFQERESRDELGLGAIRDSMPVASNCANAALPPSCC